MIIRVIAVSEVPKVSLVNILKGRSTRVLGCEVDKLNPCFTMSQDISDYCDNCLNELMIAIIDKKVKVTNGESE